jgi:hypothetical protein
MPKQEITQLGAENFPAFGSAQPKKAALNFLQQVKEGEEARNRQERQRASYDPEKIALLTKEQLESEGWAVLSLNLKKETIAQWNTAAKNELPPSALVNTAIYNDEYYSEEEEEEGEETP